MTHIQGIALKARRMEGALRRITSSTWGSPALVGRTLYKTTIRSILSYGCGAWFSKNLSKTLVETLQKVQNSCLRTVLGAYKATPIPVLQEELEIPSIKAYLQQTRL